jgi:hypothetical protein
VSRSRKQAPSLAMPSASRPSLNVWLRVRGSRLSTTATRQSLSRSGWLAARRMALPFLRAAQQPVGVADLDVFSRMPSTPRSTRRRGASLRRQRSAGEHLWISRRPIGHPRQSPSLQLPDLSDSCPSSVAMKNTCSLGMLFESRRVANGLRRSLRFALAAACNKLILEAPN